MPSDRDEETVDTLRVETAPFPQQITLPCCGKDATRLILDERTAGTSCRDCLTRIEFVHGQGANEQEGDEPTEQQTLVTDGGRPAAVRHRQRGWWYDTEFFRCPRCSGTGEVVECNDDLCHAEGRCMHGNNTCALCSGVGRISVDLGAAWESRDLFEPVQAPDADLWVQGKLHGVARKRHYGGAGDAE